MSTKSIRSGAARPLAFGLLSATFLATAFWAQSASAGITYIGNAQIPANLTDLSGLTDTLENGAADNLLGGFGSGIGYTGAGNTYYMVPDRGPNAIPYNPAVDDTASYVDRFQTVNVTATPGATPGTGTVSFNLVATTLLSSATPLVGAGNPNVPGNYFTGLSSGFDATNSPNGRRLDPESIRVSPDGKSIYVSDEYGPNIYQFDAKTGVRTATINVPAKFNIANPSAIGNNEITGNVSGRVANKGFEGLAISPDGTKLFAIVQSPLLQDHSLDAAGKKLGTNLRILEVDLATNTTKEFAYQLSDPSNTVSDIVAVNDHELLVDEHDTKGLGDGSKAKVKDVFDIDLTGATDISNDPSLPATGLNPGETAVTKTPFLDILAATGIPGVDFPAKIEGLAFGPDLSNGDHLLLVTSDNDFVAPNPTFIFAFDVTPDALPGFQAEEFVPEPASLAILGAGLIGLRLVRRRGGRIA